jgi:hypothetical protein
MADTTTKAKHLPFPEVIRKDRENDSRAAIGAPALHLWVRDNDNNTADFYAQGDGNCWSWANIGDWNDKIVGFVCAIGDWTFYQDVNFNEIPGGGTTGGYIVTCRQGTSVNWTEDAGIPRQTISSFVACPPQSGIRTNGGAVSSGD